MGRRVETRYESNIGGTEATSQFSWGLVDYGLRFYQPKHGRFINRDPIAEAGGLNLYEAFGGDPLNRWDFLGLKQSKVFEDDNKSEGETPVSDRVYDLPTFEVRGDPDENFDRMPISFFGGQGIPGRTFSNRMGFQPRAGEVGSVTFNDNWRFSYYEYEGDIYITEVEGPEAQREQQRSPQPNQNPPDGSHKTETVVRPRVELNWKGGFLLRTLRMPIPIPSILNWYDARQDYIMIDGKWVKDGDPYGYELRPGGWL